MTFSTIELSFFKPRASIIKLILFVLALSSFSSIALSSPIEVSAVDAPNNEKRDIEERDALPLPVSVDMPNLVTKDLEDSTDLLKRSNEGGAGLRWGPFNVGILKLYLTNEHQGPCGPKFPYNVPHYNFHVDRLKPAPNPKQEYKFVVNAHIVKYTSGGRNCLYIWDSETKTTILDKCFDNFNDALAEGISAVKRTVDTVLKNAGVVASVALTILAALGAALLEVLRGAVPVAV